MGAEMLRAGITRRQLAEAVHQGRILRVSRGCYALSTASPVRIAEVVWRADATCVTALAQYGVPALTNDSRTHLAFPSHRSFSGRNLRPPRSIVTHFHSGVPHRPHSVTEAIDTAGLCLAPVEHLVSVDAALNRGLITTADVRSFAVCGVVRRDWLLRMADPRCQSPLETLTRVELARMRIPFCTQVVLAGIGRVDFLVRGRLIVEVDGRAYHSDERAFVEDRRRDRAAVIAGYRVLRFPAQDVLHDIESVIGHIRQALDRW